MKYTTDYVVNAPESETIQIHSYGMRLRGFAPGCQPKEGFLLAADDNAFGKYHDLLVYNRKLTDKEVDDYELDYLGEGKMLKAALDEI